MTTLPAPIRVEVEYWPDTALRVQRLAARPWFAFLDSCRFAAGSGRYDIVAWDPAMTLRTVADLTVIEAGSSQSRVSDDPFTLLRAALGPTIDSIDLPFCGGAIGAFSYDLARRWHRLPARAARDIDLPEMAVGIYDRALVVDHQLERAWFVHRGLPAATVAQALALLAVPRTLTPAVLGPRFVVNSAVSPELSYAEYAASFARIKRYLTDGDCYQVNYTQRFSARAKGDPFDAYLRLRRLNAAPFAAFLRLPEAAVLSSSPERFIQVRGRAIETRPIKGTRPRGADALSDRALATALAASDKDRAENVMIVDLLRNDLGKSCEVGSVTVPQLCAVESYARVHHLVSSVRGELRAEVDALEALRGCFPGGSITGAPKLRAMEIIEELEPTRRSVYCGALGYLSCDGQMDTNIAIRTLLFQRERLYCWAGGGIVMDSELEAEYQESLDKAAALLNVFADAAVQYMGA
jgi:para-aminobenzoate synthetase component 1